MQGSLKKLSQTDINIKDIPLNHKIGISECGQEWVKCSALTQHKMTTKKEEKKKKKNIHSLALRFREKEHENEWQYHADGSMPLTENVATTLRTIKSWSIKHISKVPDRNEPWDCFLSSES